MNEEMKQIEFEKEKKLLKEKREKEGLTRHLIRLEEDLLLELKYGKEKQNVEKKN
jgi:hypothetical protein